LESKPSQRWSAILKGHCPACLHGDIYHKILSIKEHCPECGFDLTQSDVGDGAAYIAMSIIGTLVVILAIWFEFSYNPSPWMHVVLWLPFTVIGSIVTLKLAKTWLIHAQYKYRNQQK